MDETSLEVRIAAFCGRLAEMDAGERARLKRAAGRTLAQSGDALGLFYRLLPPGVPVYEEERYFLLATLYPLAESGDTGNLGNALRLARSEYNARGLERRLEALLDAEESQFPFRLRQAVRLLFSNRVAVEWPQLLRDLLSWNRSDRRVQKAWARSFFAEPAQA
jgi:CRISPR system Cascade subunit CasB